MSETFLNLGEEIETKEELDLDVGFFKNVKIAQEERREWRGNVKEDFLNRLHFPIFEDNIEYIGTLFDGGKGRGKSKKMERTAEELVIRFLEEQTTYNIIPVRSVSIAHHYFQPTDYQIVMIDDPTYYDKKLTQEAVADFNRMRHIFKKLRTSGTLITMWTCQDSYQLGKVLRKDLSNNVYVDWPSDNYSQDYIRRRTHPRAETLLKDWTKLIRDDHRIEFKGKCIISNESWCGYANFKLPETEFFINLEYIDIQPEETVKVKTALRHSSGEYDFTPVEEFHDLESILDSLANWDYVKKSRKIKTAKLKTKHIEAYILKLQGWTINNIASEYGVSDTALTNSYAYGGWFSIVQTELIGHLLEWALVQEGRYYEGYKMIAGNGRVDLLSQDKSKAIEVKCRNRITTPSKDMLSGEMQEMLEKDSHECELCLCITNKNLGLFRVYKITKSPQKDKEEKKANFTTSLSPEKVSKNLEKKDTRRGVVKYE